MSLPRQRPAQQPESDWCRIPDGIARTGRRGRPPVWRADLSPADITTLAVSHEKQNVTIGFRQVGFNRRWRFSQWTGLTWA